MTNKETTYQEHMHVRDLVVSEVVHSRVSVPIHKGTNGTGTNVVSTKCVYMHGDDV